jgi:ribosomal-protein-alanine N-acetyltransferase
MDSISFLDAKSEDIPDVIKVEETGYKFPWSEPVFLDCFKSSYIFLLAKINSEVVAYSIVSNIVGEAHLLNICVHSRYYRKGIAKRLLQETILKSRGAGCYSMLLEVRESNLSAISLYKSFGFDEIGRRKNYYPSVDGREDALMFQLDLESGAIDEVI